MTTSCSTRMKSRMGAASNRSRRPRLGGGYLGQGPGITRDLFLLGETWVAMSSDEGMLVDAIDGAGPVVFDGEGVTERMIRNIRLTLR
jgi:hypothetical protein